jgi:predicted 2-oxoglutarate/Fe(II)-dependent dioxygenase YbiX
VFYLASNVHLATPVTAAMRAASLSLLQSMIRDVHTRSMAIDPDSALHHLVKAFDEAPSKRSR